MNGLVHVIHEHPIEVSRAVEQLLALFIALLLLLLLIAQGNKAVRFGPTFGLIPEFTLLISVGLGRGLPVGALQSLQQTRGLARHDDEVRLAFFVCLYGLPAIKTGIRPREDLLNALGQGDEDPFQMTRDLLPLGPVSVAQLAPDVLSRLRHKGEDRLVTLLAFISRFIALSLPH